MTGRHPARRRATTDTRPVSLPVLETEFERAVYDLAHKTGWLAWHPLPGLNRQGHWSTRAMGDPGFPDWAFARSQAFFFRELKTDKGQLTPGQIAWGTALGPDLWGVWTPSDWDDIRATLAGRRPGKAPWLAKRHTELFFERAGTPNPDGTVTLIGTPSELAAAVLTTIGATTP